MPRRKQDCPKRMKWELENLAAAAALRKRKEQGEEEEEPAGGNESSDGGSSDDGQKSSETGDSPTASRAGSESRDSRSPSPFKTPSPHMPTHNGSALDFSQSRGGPPGGSGECPLDLSVSHSRKDGPPKKQAKWAEQSRGNWNGRFPTPDMTSKALEKMSELSRVGSTDSKMPAPSSTSRGGSSSSWQAQWLAQSSCGTKDVLRCVCCRLTFPSLSALSTHMKEANHGPPIPSLPSPKGPPPQQTPPPNKPPSPNDSLLLKETVHLPRKLVRGQDVWLGKGAEQTRQILKCMWCGQSFRSLAEMTSHMQQTQHYTNIISQEQLISWRSSEDKSSSPNSHVSAVLTCKVCDQAFSSLKELSNHMVKNSHYKEHIMRSITESGSRRRQSREKRKKSLPVRKLLELERANSEMKKEIRITCEKCGEKVPAPAFVDHLRVCEKAAEAGAQAPAKTLKSPKKESAESPRDLSCNAKEKQQQQTQQQQQQAEEADKKPGSVLNAIEKMIEKSFDYRSKSSSNNASHGISPPVGTSILKRLGIDESVDYTKPLIESSMLPLPPRFCQARPRSVSSEKSDDLSSSGGKGHNSSVPGTERERKRKAGTPDSKSNGGEEKSAGPDSEPDEPLKESPRPKSNSLSALSSMFESIGGNHDSKPPTPNSYQQNSHHPLAALQQLCDKTENTPQTVSSSRPTSTSSSAAQSSPGVDASALLGLNWSVNDGENVFKCTFCETPFLSKGAYRHHLAKMHFVQEKSPTPTSKDPDAPPAVPSDSPTSKFIKYSELAKQLSSK